MNMFEAMVHEKKFSSPKTPEMILGIFGLFDDLFVVVWCLGIINEEIEKFKKIIKKDKNSNIIEDVQFHIYDEK